MRSTLRSLVRLPLVHRVLSEASALRDRTIRAQERTLAALNLPSAEDVARLERRVRSVTSGLERLEEQIDRMQAKLRRQGFEPDPTELKRLADEVAKLRRELAKRG